MADRAAGDSGRFASLVAGLDRGAPVLVQTHDYPDIDAVASAWALATLLRARGFRAVAGHRGAIRSRSLSRLVAELGIELELDPPAPEELQVIVVDGSPANGNVTLAGCRLQAVIDHHRTVGSCDAAYLDLRPGFASCSAMILGYWADAGETVPRPIATALLAGIQADTDFLSRRTSGEDFAAYAELFGSGDFELASRIVRTVLDLRELGLVTGALASASTAEGLFWTVIEGPCGQEVLAVLAEFVIRAEELRAVVVAGRDAEGVHLSVRSKDPRLSAFDLARRALAGVGAGGGHSHSAGGFVPVASYPGDAALRDRFLALVRESQTH